MSAVRRFHALRRAIAVAPAACAPVACALALGCTPALGMPQTDGQLPGAPLAARLRTPGTASRTRHQRLAIPAAARPRLHGAHHRRPRPAPTTVLTVQQLFHVLGYPLGRERSGAFGVRTRGALSYFQRKYGLPITGYPDARTVAKMRTVAAALRTPRAGGDRPPPQQQRDLVDRLLGGVPIMALGLAVALGLALLALATLRSEPLPERDSRS